MQHVPNSLFNFIICLCVRCINFFYFINDAWVFGGKNVRMQNDNHSLYPFDILDTVNHFRT